MKRSSSVILWVSVALGSTNLFPATTDPEIAALTGTWRGQSICATDAPACHNETVVCYIKQIPNRTDVVFIQADKLVDGKAITMGAGEWQYRATQRSLELKMPRQVWLLNISGNRIEGTLTLADKTIFRRMTLSKDQ